MTCNWSLSDTAWSSGSRQRTDSWPRGGKNAFGVKCARCGPGRWHSSGALCCHAHNLISAVTSRHQFAGLNIRCAARSPISGDREHHFSPSHLWANGQHSHWKWPCLLFQQEEIVQMLGALSGSRCGRASWVDNWKDRLFFIFFQVEALASSSKSYCSQLLQLHKGRA